MAERSALVFSGGLNFATHAGVMAEMATWSAKDGTHAKWLENFDVLVGTSGGSVYASLFAAGYTPAELALMCELFADPTLHKRILDWNLTGAAAAFLRHDLSYALGAIQGTRVRTLLEVLFTKGFPQYVHDTIPDPGRASAEVKQQLAAKIADRWAVQQRKAAKKGMSNGYFNDQITFDDCPQLFIIAANAYTGQKTVFAYRPRPGRGNEFDDDRNMYEALKIPYLNDLAKQKEEHFDPTGGAKLKFRRFESRLYRQYDRDLYGEQFPLALAVRASLSIPVFYEPLRIRRQPEQDPRGGVRKGDQDLFVDGGVTDNMSISVAMDPFLGESTNVLAISLGNLGYRLPRSKVATNPAQVLLKSNDYLGDALVDHQLRREHARRQRLMVLNALAAHRVRATRMDDIPEVVRNGREIAQDFWRVAHDDRPYPGPAATVEWNKVFRRGTGVAEMHIYLSERARGDDPPELPPPLRHDLTPWEAIWPRPTPLGPAWGIVYAAIALVTLGLASLLFPARRGRAASARIGLAGVVATRLIAFAIWKWGAKETPPPDA
jgi:predicted acylesterase/phospholipase RssA